MHTNNPRTRLVVEARRLTNIRHENGEPYPMLDADLTAAPAKLSCTGFVVIVFRRALGDALTQSFAHDAYHMWSDLPGGLTMVPTALVLPGDLAFFTREGDSSVHVHTGPGGSPQEWHVMLASIPATDVIGACPMRGLVEECPLVQYVEREDDRGRRWTLAGYLRPPGL